MKLENIYSMDFEINAFGTSLIGSAKVDYEVYTDGKNYEDNLNVKNIKIGAAGFAHNFSKIDIETIIEENIKALMQEVGSFSFDKTKAVLNFHDDEIFLITETILDGKEISEIIDELILTDEIHIVKKLG